MRDIYAASFALEGDGVEPPFHEARERVVDWIVGHAATGNVLARGAESAEFAPGHQVAWETLTSERALARVWSGLYRHVDEYDPTLAWRTSFQLAEQGTDTRFTIRVALDSVGLRVAPATFEFGPPRIVRTLADRLDGRLDGRPLRSAPEHLLSDHIGRLVELLVDQHRRLPVIVLSTHERTGRPLVDPNRTAERLVGLAHVMVMDTTAASFELTNRLDKLRTVFGGAIRIYWPGFALDADPYDHPVFLEARIEASEARRRPFDRYLADVVNRVAVVRVPAEPLLRELRIEVEGDHRREEEERRRLLEVAKGEVPAEFASELERAWDRIANLERQVDTLTAELARLGDENEQLRRNFALIQAAAVSGESQDSPELLPVSIVEALDRVGIDYGDALVILEAARESAAASPYSNVAKFYAALQAVGEVARMYREQTLLRGFEAAFEERGLELGAVSKTALGKYPNEYERSYEGRKIALGPHLKLGSGTSAGNLARVYWWVDEPTRRLVIGHVGRHLKDGTT
jgi:hypothetical protein